MQPLRQDASLLQIQAYVRQMEAEQGLDAQDLMPQCLKLGEEVGELFRAILKRQGPPEDPQDRTADVAGEAADVLILLVSIANRCGISLEEAFRAKEARNETRTWR